MRPAFVAVLGLALTFLAASPLLAAEPEGQAKERFSFVSVAGAPGDGEAALAAALSRRLAAIGLKPATEFQANVYEVQGTVRLTPAAKGKQTVDIIWVLLDPDGNQLGVIRQSKDIRKGSLDKKWGGAADAAAQAAAADIAKLLPR